MDNKSSPINIGSSSSLTNCDKLFEDTEDDDEDFSKLLGSSKVRKPRSLSQTSSQEILSRLSRTSSFDKSPTSSPKEKVRLPTYQHPLDRRSSLSDEEVDDGLIPPKRSSTPLAKADGKQKTFFSNIHSSIKKYVDDSHDEKNSSLKDAVGTMWQHRQKLYTNIKQKVPEKYKGWVFNSSSQQVGEQSISGVGGGSMQITEKELVSMDVSSQQGSRSMPSISQLDLSKNESLNDPPSTTCNSFAEHTKKKHESRSGFAVTLSSLMKRRGDEILNFTSDETITPPTSPTAEDRTIDVDAVTVATDGGGGGDDGDQEQESNEKADVRLSSSAVIGEEAVEETADDKRLKAGDLSEEQQRKNMEMWQQIVDMILWTNLLLLYSVFPLWDSLIWWTQGYIVGLLSGGVVLFFHFQPRVNIKLTESSQRFAVNSDKPEAIPKKSYRSDLPVKGWMNEIEDYDAQTYHITNTTSTYITIDNSMMRLQTPSKNIPRRCMHKEGNIAVQQVTHQRYFDLVNATVCLKPDGLVNKRIWSKKYPICVRFSSITKHESNGSGTNDGKSEGDDEALQSTANDVTTLHLFGRTGRQKEEWFYRIQQAINQARRKKAIGDQPQKDDTNSWQVLEDEPDPVQSCLNEMTEINEDSRKIYQDYYVQMARLLPDPTLANATAALSSTEEDAKDDDKNSDETGNERKSPEHRGLEANTSEPGLQCSWINVFIGRIGFDFFRQPVWTNHLYGRIQKKLDKIKLPYFIGKLNLLEMNLGSSTPLVHQISLPRIDEKGIWVEAEVTYNGSFQMTLETFAYLNRLGNQDSSVESGNEDNDCSSSSKLNAIVDSEEEDSAESSDDEANEPSIADRIKSMAAGSPTVAAKSSSSDASSSAASSSSTAATAAAATTSQAKKPWYANLDGITKSKTFKTITEVNFIKKGLDSISRTPALLTVELLQMRGVITVNIPPPPTDRIWYGFREPPELDLKAFPKFGSSYFISTRLVADPLEKRLKQELIKLLVMPNMEDIPIPLLFANREHI